MPSRIVRLCLMTLIAALLCACSGGGSGHISSTPTSAATGTPSVWTILERRPLQVPHLAAGAACPAAHGHQISPSFGLGLGDGPAYPVGLGADGVLRYTPPSTFDSAEWGGAKVLWAVDTPHYPNVVLVRGQQLDGSNELRFEGGNLPPTELRLMPFPGSTPEGWTGQPSYTRVRAPGCYGYQIDGMTFSRVIVFQAEPAS